MFGLIDTGVENVLLIVDGEFFREAGKKFV